MRLTSPLWGLTNTFFKAHSDGDPRNCLRSSSQLDCENAVSPPSSTSRHSKNSEEELCSCVPHTAHAEWGDRKPERYMSTVAMCQYQDKYVNLQDGGWWWVGLLFLAMLVA